MVRSLVVSCFGFHYTFLFRVSPRGRCWPSRLMVEAWRARGEEGEGWVVKRLMVSCSWFLVLGFVLLSCFGCHLLGDVGLLPESRQEFSFGLSHFQYKSLSTHFWLFYPRSKASRGWDLW